MKIFLQRKFRVALIDCMMYNFMCVGSLSRGQGWIAGRCFQFCSVSWISLYPKIAISVKLNFFFFFWFHLCRAGLLKTSTALNMTQYLSGETSFPPWEVAIKWFYTLGDLLSLTSLYGKYRVMVVPLLNL